MSLGEIDWVAASFCLPRDENLPVVVRLVGGKIEKRTKIEGDWRQVVAWRKWKPEI